MRLKFLNWLREKVFKVDATTVSPKALRIIYHILYPMRYFYHKQSGIKYDPEKDIYTINGYEFTGQVIETMGRLGRAGAEAGEKHKQEMLMTIGVPRQYFSKVFLQHHDIRVKHHIISLADLKPTPEDPLRLNEQAIITKTAKDIDKKIMDEIDNRTDADDMDPDR